MQRDQLGFLGVYDLDFFSITNDVADGQDLVWTGVFPTLDSIISDTTPAFSWNSFSGIESYEFRMAESQSALSGASIAPVSDATYQIPAGLANNTVHYWQVRGVSSSGSKTDWRPAFSFTVSWGAMTGLSPTDGTTVTDTTPTLSWDEIEGAVKYEVQVAESESSLVGATAIEVTETEYTPSEALEIDTTYWWRVRAVDAEGQETAWSTVISVAVSENTSADLPDPVTNSTATAGDGQVALSWSDPSDADLESIEITWSPDGTTGSTANAGTTVSGQLYSSNDEDFYAISVTESSVINVSFDSPKDELYNDCFTVSKINGTGTILSSTASGNDIALSAAAASSGTDYVKVADGYFHADEQYSFTVTVN